MHSYPKLQKTDGEEVKKKVITYRPEREIQDDISLSLPFLVKLIAGPLYT